MAKKKIIIVIIAIGISVLCISFIITLFFWFTFFNNGTTVETSEIYSDSLYYKQVDEKKIGYDKNNNQIVSDQLILETDNISKKNVEKLIKKYNGNIVGFIAATNTYQIEFSKDVNQDEILKIMEMLGKNKHIKSVSFNYITLLKNQNYPNDKEWEGDWSSVPSGGNWGLEAIDVPKAWDYIQNKEIKKINIGVLECYGLQEEHEDLKDNIESTLGNYSQTKLEHGTLVTGIIAAKYNNQKGISGIMPNNGKINYYSLYGGQETGNFSEMMSLKVGLVNLITSANSNNQTAILNLSLGDKLLNACASYGNQNAISQLEKINEELANFLKILLEKNYEFLLIKSAGNTNSYKYLKVDYDDNNKNDTMYGYVPYTHNQKSEDYKKYSHFYPTDENKLISRLSQGNCDAQYDYFSGIKDEEIKNRILIVGATQNEGNGEYKLSEQYSVCGSRVDLLAPGTDIESTVPNNKYTSGHDGTSCAAPYVTSVAGLVLSIDKTLSGNEIKDILVKSGTGSYRTYISKQNGSKDESNYTMVNAYNALRITDMNEKTLSAYKAYGKKVKEYQEKYGIINESYTEYYDLTMQLEGLCYAKLIDFNNDGLNELFMVYRYANGICKYHYDIFGYTDDGITLLESSKESVTQLLSEGVDFTGELYNGDAGTEKLCICRYKDNIYIKTGVIDDFIYNYYHGYGDNNNFGIQESLIIERENNIFTKNNEMRTYESIEEEINKYEVILELPMNNYIYHIEDVRDYGEDVAKRDIDETFEKLNLEY